ncbi:MAG: hypothetical protein Ta2B_02260 [Termitinemataceae bacterium]|nr:MAG: hypothetical protein Ta2B_02260 [Termitinemataceae bacterium]
MDIYEKEYCITVGDVDKSQGVKPSYLFEVFQEITTIDGDRQNIGIGQLQQFGMAWVLSRLSVVVDKRPMFGQTVKASTWPRGPEKLFMLRDYLIKDKSEEVVVRARSRWLLLDTEKRRPLRPSALPIPVPLNDGCDALICDYVPAKREGLQKVMERTAVYSDLDFNGHVNNSRYIQWVQDAVDPKLIEDADKMRIDINYVSEIRIGETLNMFCAPFTCEAENANKICGCNSFAADEWNNDGITKIAIEGIKKCDGQSSFRAELRLNGTQ